MSKKWRIATCVVLLLFVLVILVPIIIPFFSDKFQHDLRFSLSDGVQILIIATAVLLPLYTEFWKRKEFEPKPEIKFEHKYPYTIKSVSYLNEIYWHKINVFLGIKNSGKSKLESSEVILTGIERLDERTGRWESSAYSYPTNLFWKSGDEILFEKEDWLTEINPGREKIVYLGWFIKDFYDPIDYPIPLSQDDMEYVEYTPKSFWKHESGQLFFFSYYRKIVDRPGSIGSGVYRLELKIFGKDIEPVTTKVTLKWDGNFSRENNQYPRLEITI